MRKAKQLSKVVIYAHRRLLDLLGGPTAVAKLIEQRLDVQCSRHSVSMWRRRGVPKDYRPCLAARAEEVNIKVPPKFIDHGLGAGKLPAPTSEEVPFLDD